MKERNTVINGPVGTRVTLGSREDSHDRSVDEWKDRSVRDPLSLPEGPNILKVLTNSEPKEFGKSIILGPDPTGAGVTVDIQSGSITVHDDKINHRLSPLPFSS